MLKIELEDGKFKRTISRQAFRIAYKRNKKIMKAFFQNFLAITKKTGIVASMGARYGATIDIDNKIWCWVAFNDIFTEEELLVTNKIMEDEFGYTITYHKDINQNRMPTHEELMSSCGLDEQIGLHNAPDDQLSMYLTAEMYKYKDKGLIENEHYRIEFYVNEEEEASGTWKWLYISALLSSERVEKINSLMEKRQHKISKADRIDMDKDGSMTLYYE